MTLVLTPVKDWRLVDPTEAVAQFEHDPRFAVVSHRLHAGEVSPVTLYCYLKSRFGRPNGEMMAFRSAGSDNVVQWHYKLASHGFVLDVLGTNAGIQLVAHGTVPVAPEEWSRVFEELTTDFGALGPRMRDSRQSLEKWTQFVNPFRRLELSVLYFENQLMTLDLEPPAWPPNKSTIAIYLESLQKYSMVVADARRAGFCLRLLAPIYAESFLNLVLYVLRNDNLATSDERYREAVRLPINVRVESLPKLCKGFAAPLDGECPEYREFLRLMNGRNDLVHGNCDPTQLKVGDVYFDGTIPLWQRDGSTIARLSQCSMQHVTKDEAMRDVEVVRSFIRWILRCMKPEFAAPLRQIMASDYPGFQRDSGRMAILLPNDIYESYLP